MKKAADITTGLVGHYSFENTLANKIGTGTAKLHGGAGDTWNSPATGTVHYKDSIEGFGKAYEFLGNNGNISGEGLELDITLPQQFTIAYWVNPDTVNSATSMVFSPVTGDEGLNIADNWFGSTFPTARLWKVGGSESYLDNFIGSADALCGKWSHIALTADASGSLVLYVNGEQKDTKANASVLADLKNMPLFLGINFWDASFDGLMDELYVYNRALTAEDIARLCAVPVTGVEVSAADSGSITSSIVYATEADKAASKPSSARYGTCQCSAKVLPAAASNKSVTWSVACTTPGEAAISETGLVTLNEKAKSGDTITVRATSVDNPSVYGECQLSVTVAEVIAGNVTEITDENAGDYYKPVNRDRISVHDPAIVKEGGTYYIFGSHLSWAKSTDLINWTPFTNNISTNYETLFANEFEWAKAGDPVYKPAGNLWAPDVIWNDTMNKWCMYMSINGCSWNSCICLLTADNLSGNWTYEGPVVYSGFTGNDVSGGIRSFEKTDYSEVTGKSTLDSKFIRDKSYSEKDNGTACQVTTWEKNYGAHAIDACVFYDEEGKLWFTYGSWSGGIYMFELDQNTGYRLNTAAAKANYTDAYMGKKLGGSSASGEASYIEYINGYYYMFISYGGFVANGGYNMRVFRSANPDGPYTDVSGNGALEGGGVNGAVGTRLMSYYKWSWWDYAHVAQGHNSAFVDDDGNAYLIYHTRTNDGTEGHTVRVHQLFTTENGYLVTAPFEYSKSDSVSSTGYQADEIAGTYEVLFQKNTNNTALEYNKPNVITLSGDGEISGDVSGTWTSKPGSPLVSMVINKITYEGTFVRQTMEGSNVSTLCFTTVGSDDICLWGAKYPDDRTAVAWTSSYITIPSNIYSDLELETKGLFGATITWKSDNTSVLGNDGSIKGEMGTVTLTATIRKGECFRTMSGKVEVRPKDSSGKTLVAEYFTNSAADLAAGIKKGTYQYTNPFNQKNISGLSMDNGVSISFDYERNGADIAKLGAIFAFKVTAASDPRMFLTDGTYLGYNGWDGNFFDANNDYDTMVDFIGAGKKHVELVLEPTGFTLNVDGKKAYDVEDFNNGTISKNINDSGSVNYSKMLKWLNETADELHFGWGSFWTNDADAVKAKISNVKFYVLPTEEFDISDYAYYENYNNVYEINDKWASERTTGSIGNIGDSYQNYTNLAADGGSSNGSASTEFGDKVASLDSYVIELDAALRSGNIAHRSMSEFVITGTDCNASISVSSPPSATLGYILKLATKELDGNAGQSTSNTEDWYINDTETKITLPLVKGEPQWIHIKAVVDRENGKADLTITSGGTELYAGEVDINGSGILKGLYVMLGRGNGLTKVDNIAVYEPKSLESISLNYKELELAVGGSRTLVVSRKPSFAGTGTVKWTSANTQIATVSADGKVTGTGNGTTVITAELDGIKATCKVIVGDVPADKPGSGTDSSIPGSSGSGSGPSGAGTGSSGSGSDSSTPGSSGSGTGSSGSGTDSSGSGTGSSGSGTGSSGSGTGSSGSGTSSSGSGSSSSGSDSSGSGSSNTPATIAPANSPAVQTPIPTGTPVPDTSSAPSATEDPGTAVPTQTPAETPAGDNPSVSEPTAQPQKTTAPNNTPAPVKPDNKVVVNNLEYTVTSTTGTKAVEYTNAKKNSDTIIVPASVKINGKKYEVTSIKKNALKGNKKVKKVVIGKNIKKIGKNAFKNCSKLKVIVIKSKKLTLKKTGNNAFKGINSKAELRVPKGMVSKYKKLVKAKGAGKKISVKAIKTKKQSKK